MALTQFIKDLLYLHDKLIIPGFGGFVAQYIPSQINTEKNLISPPVKYFIFDASLTEDDNVFAQYISHKKSVSISEAQVAINEMVADFKKKLSSGSTLFIEEVGYLIQDDNKVIRFKRDEEQNYHPESYGLDPVAFKPLPQPVESPEETYYPVKKKNTVVRILVIFLFINIIGALSAFVYWKFDDIKSYFSKITERKKEVPAEPDTLKYHINPDTTELGQSIDTSTNIRNALRYEETPPAASQMATDQTQKNFYIIAGSFKTFDKAELHAKLLSKSGLKPEIIQFGQDLFRISVGEFKSKEEAVEQLEQVKAKKGAENAWLLTK